MSAIIAYAPGRHPLVTLDCATCTGTGIGQFGDPNTSRCTTCRGRGYFTHAVSFDCDCPGCREYRGEVCDVCGADLEADEGRHLPCVACNAEVAA